MDHYRPVAAPHHGAQQAVEAGGGWLPYWCSPNWHQHKQHPGDGKARVGWSEHPQAEQVLLKKLHQPSMAVEVFAVELGVSWRPALGKQSFGLHSAPQSLQGSLQGRQTHEEAMSH